MFFAVGGGWRGYIAWAASAAGAAAQVRAVAATTPTSARRAKGRTTMAIDYEAFVEKFKPKKTTDDCYTPPLIYDTVCDWACEQYGIDPEKIVRPFWPGGDYLRFEYPAGCVVLDNPPFSILTKICEFYLDAGIPFFLFAPGLTALSGRNVVMRMNHIIADADIVYDNGAVVHTAFVTSFGGDVILQSAPELHDRIAQAVEKLKREKTRSLPKYTYPDNIVTAAIVKKYAKYGIDFCVRRRDCVPVAMLDEQRPVGKGIFGGGLLCNSKIAADRAAAERWQLSVRECEIVASLDAGTLPQADGEQLRMW